MIYFQTLRPDGTYLSHTSKKLRHAGESRHLVSEPKYGIESAFFFWDANNLNTIADTDKINDVTMAVNNGLNGLADRIARLTRIKNVMEK